MKLYYTEEEVKEECPDLLRRDCIVRSVYLDLLYEINSQVGVEVKTVCYLRYSIAFGDRIRKSIWVLEGFRNYVFDLHNIKHAGV